MSGTKCALRKKISSIRKKKWLEFYFFMNQSLQNSILRWYESSTEYYIDVYLYILKFILRK